MDNGKPQDRPSPASRKTLRLTFRISNGNIELLKQEHLDKVTPPQVGERPRADTHAGFWVELQDSRKRVIAHRIISDSLLDSVEVHSPDGRIERKFGELRDGVFEVLLPDVEGARSAVLIGTSRKATPGTDARAQPSSEMGRFDLAGNAKRGER